MKPENFEDVNSLIARWLSGEASQADMQQLNTWVDSDEKNASYLSEMEKLWEHMHESGGTFNTDSAWEKVKFSMDKPQAKSINMRIVFRIGVAMAACLGIFFAARFFFPTNKNGLGNALTDSGLFVQAGDMAYTTTLPDHTEVVLSPHSSISADSSFGISNRRLRLKGSAHFSTRHGSKTPFIVITENTVVEDIGTAFWVKSENDGIKVIVTEGEVKVSAFHDSTHLLKGDSAVVNKIEEKLRILAGNTTQKVVEVRDKTLEFLKTELQKVTTVLNSTYHTDIRLGNPDIAKCRLTAKFDNQDIETVLEVIRETFNLEIRREGNTIVLDGKGCQ